MAKFYGIIGYVETIETEPGVWIDDNITEREYSGDLIRNFGKHESSGGVNDNININNQISILADPYATEHFLEMQYVKFNIPNIGGLWKVTNVEVAYPRVILSLGGVYNGNSLRVTE